MCSLAFVKERSLFREGGKRGARPSLSSKTNVAQTLRPAGVLARPLGASLLLRLGPGYTAPASRVPFRLLYSTRTPDDAIYTEELRRRGLDDLGLDVVHLYTRQAPPEDKRGVGRLTAVDLVQWGWPPEFQPAVFVCGPTGFVEAAADLLVDAGHEPKRIKTERFGG